MHMNTNCDGRITEKKKHEWIPKVLLRYREGERGEGKRQSRATPTGGDDDRHGRLLHDGADGGEGGDAAVVPAAVLLHGVGEVEVSVQAHGHPLILLDVLQVCAGARAHTHKKKKNEQIKQLSSTHSHVLAEEQQNPMGDDGNSAAAGRLEEALTDGHPVDLQRWDPSGRVALQNEGLTLLHHHRVDSLFGKLGNVWKRPKRRRESQSGLMGGWETPRDAVPRLASRWQWHHLECASCCLRVSCSQVENESVCWCLYVSLQSGSKRCSCCLKPSQKLSYSAPCWRKTILKLS